MTNSSVSECFWQPTEGVHGMLMGRRKQNCQKFAFQNFQIPVFMSFLHSHMIYMCWKFQTVSTKNGLKHVKMSKVIEICIYYNPETPNSAQNWRFFCPAWPWNLTDDLEKQQDASSMMLQALCIFSQPWVNSKWTYSPETPNLGQNQWFFSRVTLKFDGRPWKTIGHLS